MTSAAGRVLRSKALYVHDILLRVWHKTQPEQQRVPQAIAVLNLGEEGEEEDHSNDSSPRLMEVDSTPIVQSIF